MNSVETLAIVSSIVSIVLAVVAIVLSILFYRWSDQSNKDIQKASTDIDSNTKKLENLFDKLYTGTFGLMKSNVEAMQQQLYNPASFSSGDSSLNQDEYIEEVILSIIVKSKVVTRESICFFFTKMKNQKPIEEIKIVEAIERLHKNGSIYTNQNLISISNVNPVNKGTEKVQGSE